MTSTRCPRGFGSDSPIGSGWDRGSLQNFQVVTENAIWARILGIHNVASNLGPKLLGLYMSHPDSQSDPIGGSEPSSGCETWDWDSLPDFFFF